MRGLRPKEEPAGSSELLGEKRRVGSDLHWGSCGTRGLEARGGQRPLERFLQTFLRDLGLTAPLGVFLETRQPVRWYCSVNMCGLPEHGLDLL